MRKAVGGVLGRELPEPRGAEILKSAISFAKHALGNERCWTESEIEDLKVSFSAGHVDQSLRFLLQQGSVHVTPPPALLV